MDEIIVNGEAKPIDGPVILSVFLEELGVGTKWVLVERNGEPVFHENYGSVTLMPGDRLESATPMAGG